MAQLGKAVGILLRFEQETSYCYEDLRAFHAPSECYGDVERGLRRRFRTVRRHACSVAGVKNLRALRKRVKAVCPTWDRYNHFRLGIQEI
jgi:hypothetical protein